ncbi:HK97 family phage prohead protease/HK97 family phage major capsid protein,TIGR01554 [Hoeflea halophila]|uniref:HK97 family phage prohead protease/HK97 family phage major capsid protein,TIGR01554 n=2 Tax=Hoeflea halophila TaxID=714899 RepID=A0A286IBM4_9HYPH|nr:HK97 family phage prohead protease/HK97 family phage major capsid protein,TIGR01554 [Hoeflea halophila]
MTTDWSASGRQHKRVDLALEDVSGDGSFSGYASLFGAVDLGRDVIEPGAFAASLKRRGATDVRMLYQHDPDQPIGRWLSIREDARGLHVEGKLALGVARAREVHELMKSGALDGLSIGFQTLRARTEAKAGIRRIMSADLWEISVVTFPMQPGARVTAVKALGQGVAAPTRRELERRLTRDAGLTRRQARGLIARGYGALSDRQDAAPEDLKRLITRMRSLTGALFRSSWLTDLKKLKGLTMTTAFDNTRAPETKSVDADVSAAFEDFMSAFEHYKQSNDERLAEIERRGSADIVTEEKMARIDTALDEQKRALDALAVKRARPDLGRGGGAAPSPVRQAFDAYVRRGDEAGLRQAELKAMSAGSDPDGGYLVPDELDSEIGRRLSELSPIRSIATVRQVSGAVLKKPFALDGMATGWVGETDARPQTAAPQLAELQFPTMELYAMPAATASLIEDGALDIEGWIASEVEAAFAEQEGAAIVTGDGVNKPRGFLDYPSVDDDSWSWGNLGHIATGSAGAFGADPSDRLVELIYALKAGHRQNGRFVMNRKTQSQIRKFKDADGNYLWVPPAGVGQAASLMGFPVVEAEDMPDVAADALAIAFGDFRRGYLVVDRTGVRVLRDPYSAKPYVLFYTTKRVGGGVQNFEAIKLLKFAA